MRKKECQPEKKGPGKMPWLLAENMGRGSSEDKGVPADTGWRAATGACLQDEGVRALDL